MYFCCFQYVKDTKKKANHNRKIVLNEKIYVVSNTSKILKRKQITTYWHIGCTLYCCFQYVKDTKKKANHNRSDNRLLSNVVVSNTSKILKRKQITTSKQHC